MSSTMALARAFTKRAKRNQETPAPARGGSVRYAAGTINRNLISLPTELISTTNVHALTAPDIRQVSSSSAGSSGSSISSGNDSDFSTIDRSFLSTPTSPDTATESSPATPITPIEGSDFLENASKRSATAAGMTTQPTPDVPAIPQRALSHSKQAHVELSRKRSIQRMSPPPTNLTSAKPVATVRNSTDFFTGTSNPGHPFGKELAQVNEVAEEFGATSAVLDEEEQELLNKGLCKFGVEDYLDEISGLYGGVFEGHLGPMAKPWI